RSGDPDQAPEPAGLALPAGLRQQVVEACGDSTPAGRAYRARVVYRAGPFGRDGFPKSPGPRWWLGVRRHPRAAAAAVAAMAAAVAGITVMLTLSAPHQARASTLGLGAAPAGAPALPAGWASGPSGPPQRPAQRPSGPPA